MLYRIYLLIPLVSALNSVTAQTLDRPVDQNVTELEKVVVSAGDGSELRDVAQQVLILDREDLQKNSGNSLGTLLEDQPGMSNASFGPGVGRPVIRGMSGSRVKMMLNGHDSADLSAMSSDHAPMAEVANATQVEVLQGPATLMYGNGAIGGVVNVIDNKIATQPEDHFHGSASAKYTSVDQGKQVAAELNGGNGVFAWHLDGFTKQTENYRSGEKSGKSYEVKNSDTKSSGGSIGLSWTPEDKGFVGFSISQLDYDYGVPNEDNSPTRVQPEQIRYDLKSSWLNPVSGISAWHNEISFNDYQHDELTKPVVEGLFDQETWEYNSRLNHEELFGWKGYVGLQLRQQQMKLCHDHDGCSKIPDYSDQVWSGSKGGNFTQVGDHEFVHDTPMPETETIDIGYYLVEKYQWAVEGIGSGNLELGARLDFRTISADPKSISTSARQSEVYYSDKDFTPLTLSIASTWQVNEQQRWALSIARAQRAPDAQEMYWNGDHHATFSYQLDNPDLIEETAYTFDVNWIWTSEALLARVAAYHYQFQNYIYNDLKDVKDPYHGHAVYGYEQADASFQGGEAVVDYQFAESWAVSWQGDYVSAQLTEGEDKDLPRTPPATTAIAVKWASNFWSADIENRWVFAQSNTAAQETKSDAYQHLNLHLNYNRIISSEYEIQAGVQVNNVFDEFAQNHVSYLKEFAPLPGRNIGINASIQF